MPINKLINVPFNDFKRNEEIEPEQFDTNNQTIVMKIDEIVEQTNQNTLDAQAALDAAVDFQEGVMLDGSITDAKLSNAEGQIKQRVTELEKNVCTSVLTATGTANDVVINTNGGFDFVQGASLSFKASGTNTGNMTVAVDGTSKILVTTEEVQVPVGMVKANKVYDIFYDPARNPNYFFLLARASGNATPSDILAPKTASTDLGEVVGTMVNRGAMNFLPYNLNQPIPQGYHNGSGIVIGDADLVASNIKKDVSIFNIVGDFTGLIYTGDVVSLNTSPPQCQITSPFVPKIIVWWRKTSLGSVCGEAGFGVNISSFPTLPKPVYFDPNYSMTYTTTGFRGYLNTFLTRTENNAHVIFNGNNMTWTVVESGQTYSYIVIG